MLSTLLIEKRYFDSSFSFVLYLSSFYFGTVSARVTEVRFGGKA